MAVLEAADDLLVELGFAGVTIEGIAGRAGVAKQTIYRWWDSKTDILFDALAVDAAEYFTVPDHGDLGSDLRDQLAQLAAFLTSTDAGAVCRAIAGQAQHDPAVAARFTAEFAAPQRERERVPFLRARGRGELDPAADIDLAIDQLAGPVYYRVLVTGQPVPHQFTDALVDRYLAQAGLRLRPLRDQAGRQKPAGRYGELWSAAGDRGWTDSTPSSSCRTAAVYRSSAPRPSRVSSTEVRAVTPRPVFSVRT
jgi:AcrR family transcriptional regulator